MLHVIKIKIVGEKCIFPGIKYCNLIANCIGLSCKVALHGPEHEIRPIVGPCGSSPGS